MARSSVDTKRSGLVFLFMIRVDLCKQKRTHSRARFCDRRHPQQQGFFDTNQSNSVTNTIWPIASLPFEGTTHSRFAGFWCHSVVEDGGASPTHFCSSLRCERKVLAMSDSDAAFPPPAHRFMISPHHPLPFCPACCSDYSEFMPGSNRLRVQLPN